MTAIRPFRNTDVQALCEVWNAHHASAGFESQMDPLRLELFALAKPYFDEQALLVAEATDGEVVGFLHFGPTSSEDGSDVDGDQLGIFALCIRDEAGSEVVASQLLDRFVEIATLRGAKQCRFRPLLPNAAFYLGLGPADSMVGATSHEVRTCNWLAQAGFVPKTPTCLWELELATFQAPVDRIQIQIRRAAMVTQHLEEPQLPWWQACSLAHAEPTSFNLTHRTEKRVLSDVLYWALSPELQTSSEAIVWLWPMKVNDEPLAEECMTFLLAESLRQFQNERIDTIRTPALADEQINTNILRKLGFRANYNGMVFGLELGSNA